MRDSIVAVSIIGAGAIGLLIAAHLKHAGVEVTLYTRTETQAKKLEEEGVYLTYDGNDRHVRVRANKLTLEEKIIDPIIIVTVKQYQLATVLPFLKQNSDGKTFIFIQNGMGHLSHLKELHHCQIILGIVEHGATKINENKVIHTGLGKTKIAYYTEKGNHSLCAFIQSWGTPYFPIEFQTDWYEMLAYKLVANAVINPLTAIFQVTNGTLLTNDYLFKLMRNLFHETVRVLELEEQKLWDYVVTICKQTAKNQSSMLRDIQAKRRTEIDAISGYIIERAKEQGINVPYTIFIFNSIKAYEQLDKKEGRQNGN